MEKLYKCSCHSHGFSVEADEELKMIYLVYWSLGKTFEGLTWRERIKYLWRIVRGRPYEDEIVLTSGEALKLGACILEAGLNLTPPKETLYNEQEAILQPESLAKKSECDRTTTKQIQDIPNETSESC